MNPGSARSALQAIAGLCTATVPKPRRIAVFGAMLELGGDSDPMHRAVGAEVAATGQDMLVCVGKEALPIGDGAVQAGMAGHSVHVVDDIGAAVELLRGLLRSGDFVLCKASRRFALDRLVDRLLAELGETDRQDGTTCDAAENGG
jgi:UDP-N-acetylmuramoyl-tripeptide--D-alanyl-D-alanine ligase